MIPRKPAVLALVLCPAILVSSATASNLIVNGDFQTGNLSGWTSFVTSNGNLGSSPGLPAVSSFFVTTAASSDAAEFQVGQRFFTNLQDKQGGGISQSFDSPAGVYVFSANIAAYNANNLGNGSPGAFSLLVDGTTAASYDFATLGLIQSGQTLRTSLLGTLTLSAGTHNLQVLITRTALNSSSPPNITPFQYIDDISVSPVPEPGSVALLSVGSISGLYFFRVMPRRNRWQGQA
jgi:hypothetical protein